jgi:hypothetical protein
VKPSGVDHASYVALLNAVRANPIRTKAATKSASRCQIRISVTPGAIARLYARRDITSKPNAELLFDFQEIFYQWRADLFVDHLTQQLLVRISHLGEKDTIATSPSLSSVGAAQSEWFSGFQEPSRDKPDYYARVIKLENLAKGETVRIIVRRALELPDVAPVSVIRLDEVRSTESCLPQIPTFDEESESRIASAQAKTLALFRYGRQNADPAPLPLAHDPGDVASNELQATVEASCKNPECDHVVIKNLEVHMGNDRATSSNRSAKSRP